MRSKLPLLALLLLNVTVSYAATEEESNDLHHLAFPLFDLSSLPSYFQENGHPIEGSVVKYEDALALYQLLVEKLATTVDIKSMDCQFSLTVGTATFFYDNFSNAKETFSKGDLLKFTYSLLEKGFNNISRDSPGCWTAFMSDATATAVNLFNVGFVYKVLPKKTG